MRDTLAGEDGAAGKLPAGRRRHASIGSRCVLAEVGARAAEQPNVASGGRSPIGRRAVRLHPAGLLKRRRRRDGAPVGRVSQSGDLRTRACYPSDLGLAADATRTLAEFNLSVFRELGEDAVADELLGRIRNVTGEKVTGAAWLAVPLRHARSRLVADARGVDGTPPRAQLIPTTDRRLRGAGRREGAAY